MATASDTRGGSWLHITTSRSSGTMQCLPTQSWATQRSEAEMSNISEKKNLDMRNKVQSDTSLYWLYGTRMKGLILVAER